MRIYNKNVSKTEMGGLHIPNWDRARTMEIDLCEKINYSQLLQKKNLQKVWKVFRIMKKDVCEKLISNFYKKVMGFEIKKKLQLLQTRSKQTRHIRRLS